MTGRGQVVDAHHHLWDLDRHPYQWLSGSGTPEHNQALGDYAAIRKNYLLGDLMDDYGQLGVCKAVHVEAGWSGPDPVVETAWLQEIADEHGYPHAIVAALDLTQPHAVSALERHRSYKNVRGIRMLSTAKGSEDTDQFEMSMRAIADASLSFEISLPAEEHGRIEAIVSRSPDVNFCLGHAGFPRLRTNEYYAAWCSWMKRLANYPNMVVKLSGLPMMDHDWTVRSLRPWVLGAIETFGIERCLFGSNWPVDKLYSSLSDLIEAFEKIIADAGIDGSDLFFRVNAERFYSI
jgi:predicted TIM-barrel fold metal-dependent hydrolase